MCKGRGSYGKINSAERINVEGFDYLENEKDEIDFKPLPESESPAKDSVPEVKTTRVCQARSGKLGIIKRLEWPDGMGEEIVHGRKIIFEDSYGMDWAIALCEGSLFHPGGEPIMEEDLNGIRPQEIYRRGVPLEPASDNENDLTEEDKIEIAVRALEGRVIRYCDDEDKANVEHLAELEAEAIEICKDRVKAHGLPMKLLATDYRYDRSKVTFHFSAENRVDFRQLVRDLASIFKCRIELHQIGIRDEAKLYPGCGPCGETLCCQRHLTKFTSVSIRMARLQNLPLNPSKISGNCGRLMCCLNYECQTYAELTKLLPRIGDERDIDGKRCTVAFVNPLTETITLDVKDEMSKKFTVTRAEYDEGKMDKRKYKKL